MFKTFSVILLLIAAMLCGFAISNAHAEQINFDKLEYIVNSQLGTNPGGKYKNQNGQEYYAKFYPNEMQARTEFLANQVYIMFGLNASNFVLKTIQKSASSEKALALMEKLIKTNQMENF